MTDVITPEEFVDVIKMIRVSYAGDSEAFHAKTDDAMEDLLVSLGYHDAIEVIRSGTRWYA
jgi:hypothetical protein